MDPTLSLNDTETESQLYLNDPAILRNNTTLRKDRASNQHSDSTYQTHTASAKGSVTEPNNDSNADIPLIITPQAYGWAPNNEIGTHSIIMTQSNHHNTISSRVSNYDTKTELEVQYLDTVDYNTNATVETSSV
jgi:hypothetical protein